MLFLRSTLGAIEKSISQLLTSLEWMKKTERRQRQEKMSVPGSAGLFRQLRVQFFRY